MDDFKQTFLVAMFVVSVAALSMSILFMANGAINIFTISLFVFGYVKLTSFLGLVNHPKVTLPVAFVALHLELTIMLFKTLVSYPKKVLAESKEVILDEILEVKSWSGGKATGGELSLADKEKK